MGLACSSFGLARSSFGPTRSFLGLARSSLGLARSSLGLTRSSLGLTRRRKKTRAQNTQQLDRQQLNYSNKFEVSYGKVGANRMRFAENAATVVVYGVGANAQHFANTGTAKAFFNQPHYLYLALG